MLDDVSHENDGLVQVHPLVENFFVARLTPTVRIAVGAVVPCGYVRRLIAILTPEPLE